MTSRSAAKPRPSDPQTFDLLVKTIKGLSMDAVEKAKSGHPGMPMGAACMAGTLWSRFLVHDPADPSWPDRDRFVLSAGHGSMLQYALLHLTGYDLPLDEIKQFRQWGSKTPGHPEFHETAGVEVTTGPLGTGFAAGVGLALAERILAERFNRPDHTVVDHMTYGVVSDGDLMEGIAAEAASMAGHLGLGKLIYLYDDNGITIDGGTDLAFTESVPDRFRAYGWHVLQVADGHDGESVAKAIELARQETGKPSLICCRTVIGHGAPSKAGKSASHGAPLGGEELDGAKQGMDWPKEPFFVPDNLRTAMDAAKGELGAAHGQWKTRFEAYRKAHPELAADFERTVKGELPDLAGDMPTFDVGANLATRKASQAVLDVLIEKLPGLVGGSADLAGSNGVPKGGEANGPKAPGSRRIAFGVREHGMGGVLNGLALHGGMVPYGATFLVFSDFMRGAIRLAALMKLPVTYIFSHDSFFVGEDGPTHQPIEHLAALRIIPGLHVVRPADANETVGAWQHALSRGVGDGPTAIILTRQGLPVLETGARDVSKGGYTLWEPEGSTADKLDGVLVATGSEVALALDAAKQLAAKGKSVRVVSIPCQEAFDAQDQAYRDSVLPPDVTRRLSVEAGVPAGWARYASEHHGIDHFGASAPAGVLAEKFGFTPEAVVEHYLSLG